MKYLFFLFFITITPLVNASDLTIVEYSKETRDKEEYFFLYGTSKGNYIVRSWQVDMEKMWNGRGEPNLSIGQAVEKTYKYFNKSTEELGIKEVVLRPAFSKQGSVIWYYHVTLVTLPYKFGAEEHEVSVLTSGEVLVPYKPKS